MPQNKAINRKVQSGWESNLLTAKDKFVPALRSPKKHQFTCVELYRKISKEYHLNHAK